MALKQTRYIQRLKAAPESALWEGYWTCSKDTNIINLGTAENRVMDELLQPIIEHRKGITTKDETYFANLEGQLNNELASLYQDYIKIISILKMQSQHNFYLEVE